MKKLAKILSMIWLITLGLIANAQDQTTEDLELQRGRDQKAREKIEAARIGMITNKLGLTPDQAEKFWPIYREFAQKRVEIRQEFRTEQSKLNSQNPDPDQQKRLVDLGLNLKQKELDLEKTYSGRLLGIITAQQMLQLRTAERDFQRMIINQLQQRRDFQQRKENLRDRNQDLRQNKN